MEKLRKECLSPSNVPFAKAPKVYDVIWNQMNFVDKGIDIKRQKIQTVFSTTVVPLVRAAELVNTYKEVDKRQVLSHIGATMAFVGDASYYTSSSRRDHIRLLLHKDYRSIVVRRFPLQVIYWETTETRV